MRQLHLSAEAELEMFEAALWYEREQEGLGFRFESEVDRIFTRILENPGQFPEVETGARRALTRRFPYGIFFTIQDDAVTIFAVLHLHRHPDTWKARLRPR